MSAPRAISWYALRCASNRERAVHAALGLRGFETFLPAYSERVRWSDRVKIVERLLFPGYLFLRIPAEEFPGVLHVAGIIGVLPSNLKPSAVPAAEIDSIQTLLSSALPLTASPAFVAGDKITIAAGPLKGASGVVVREGKKAKLVVSVDMLNRAVSVEISPADLDKAKTA